MVMEAAKQNAINLKYIFTKVQIKKVFLSKQLNKNGMFLKAEFEELNNNRETFF